MPRKLRLQYPGAMYHLMSRGDRRENIFLDDVDRQDFIKTLAEACQKTAWQVHAYCLMSNHSHLVVETPEPNLAPIAFGAGGGNGLAAERLYHSAQSPAQALWSCV